MSDPQPISDPKKKAECHQFYSDSLTLLEECGVPFMLGGAFAIFHHTGLFRDTKDLDIFCKPNDCPKILKFFADRGYKVQMTDVRWLAKIFKDDYFIDIIFSTVNNICLVDQSWLDHAARGEFAGHQVRFLSAEELIFCKIYVQNRERFDGADVNHVLLKAGRHLDWHRLLDRMDPHWHLLLSAILLFQFVYPSDYRDIVPEWLFNELIDRAKAQYDLPSPVVNVCRGPIIDQTQYSVDVKQWDYKAVTIKTV
jgi:hypothetical protein